MTDAPWVAQKEASTVVHSADCSAGCSVASMVDLMVALLAELMAVGMDACKKER